ncbi:glycosyltransferase [Candidimonas sp. SYP-B2681]|uniref:glycosyltransferase n=1 Tax=Candidimonas sp. SYP-B2681 TaxID=2497686 RepID=UPI000F862E14|nr:glycosyltransferase [Candidimonas sp. SYP-B2681]RTZ42336.1 glycosyltransferase [Candidimonas sp. SYP-B2681]
MQDVNEKPSGRLALFIPSLNGGGAERVMVSLANGFARRGINVDLVLVRDIGVYRAEVAPEVRVVDLKGKRALTSLFSLANYLRREKPAAMLSAMNYVNVVAVWARFVSASPTRLVLSEHANLSQAVADTKGMVSKVLPWLMKVSYSRADAIVAVSDGVADDLSRTLGYSRTAVETRHNPIETVELALKSLDPLNHPWFASGEPPVIIGVGRLSKEKDFPTLIKAFGHLRRSTNARLVILGEGGERPFVESHKDASEFKDDILLAGFQGNPYNWMRGASVFVLSSRWEGFGNVLVEAMACGTPVVSTHCPSGPDEILEQGKWGRLAPVGDAIALADAIRQTLADKTPPDVKKRADAFSVDHAIDGYLNVLDPERSRFV